jgi:hypothetical protein
MRSVSDVQLSICHDVVINKPTSAEMSVISVLQFVT